MSIHSTNICYSLTVWRNYVKTFNKIQFLPSRGLKYIRFLHRAKYIRVKVLLINWGMAIVQAALFSCPSPLSPLWSPSISHDVSIAMFISEVIIIIKIMWTSSEKNEDIYMTPYLI